jgi:hypothetical protein
MKAALSDHEIEDGDGEFLAFQRLRKHMIPETGGAVANVPILAGKWGERVAAREGDNGDSARGPASHLFGTC